MWSVYVLCNPLAKDKRFYIGLTNNIAGRIKKHRTGKVYFTHWDHQSWKLVYIETYLSRDDAARREQSLKNHGQAIRQLKARIRESINLAK